MAFWSDTNLREPLRQNRWYISFGNDDLDNYAFALKECTKPSYKIETTSHVLINHTFNYPKNVVWQPISVKMVSAREGGFQTLSRTLERQLNSAGYLSPNFQYANPQISKTDLIQNNIDLIQVDANGGLIETWSLYNAFITGVNFGSLTYENDGFVEITFDIVYDSADLNVEDGGANAYAATISIVNGKPVATFDQSKKENLSEEKVNIASDLFQFGTPGFPSSNE